MLALIFITLRSMLLLVILNNLKKQKQYVYHPAIDITTVPWSGRISGVVLWTVSEMSCRPGFLLILPFSRDALTLSNI